ncbi:MAG: phytanoyl-CoA dioxygenase family protein [Acidiferrobacterales bacterium]|nr:phytanoyl-CoA dioxygenase family protein [Acidiferrobacterales bacterium]
MTLSPEQISFFNRNGFLVIEKAIPKQILEKLQTEFTDWVEQSREFDSAFGETINQKPRFDLSPEHSRDQPCLRRINAPVEISDVYWGVASERAIPAMVSDLIGDNVRFHHSKINSKLPGSGTEVKWHQDFAFTPHTNSDLVTALLMIDEVTEHNGPLQVIPGSHLGNLESLWHGGVFTGAVETSLAQRCEAEAVECIGPAGSVCLMHTKLLHGSKPNRSQSSRTLFIAVYAAADAMPCSPNPMPSRYEGEIVMGRELGKVRCRDFLLELPQLPDKASFFDQQSANDT